MSLLSYQEYGNEQTLVICHGLLGSADNWLDYVGGGATYRVIA